MPYTCLAPALAEIRERSTCENAENACATADIKHNLIPEQVLILHNGILIRLSPDAILEHLLMNGEM